MISLGSSQSTNTCFVGIQANHGSAPDPTDRIYHNTINISGTAASGDLPSFCFHRGDFSASSRTQSVDVRNNIFTNSRNGGTGLHFAIGNNLNSTSVSTGWASGASDNNVLNAGSATIGWWGASLDFAAWKTASACDGLSRSGISVIYVNPVSDLHLNMGLTPTAIESGGQNIAMVSSDIDGQGRPGPAGSVNGAAFAPDMGADEIDGIYLDLAHPVITFSPLQFTCDTNDRIITAQIADYSGVPVSGGLVPRVYYRKSSGSWSSGAGVLTAGTGINGTWEFTIPSAGLGGVTFGDVVEYFIIAQDIMAPCNIASLPIAGLVATDVNTVTTTPSAPYVYSVSSPMSGTYTVGATGDFPTLTAAVNTYNNSCLEGPVLFSLIDTSYLTESFPITILSHPDADQVNTLTIKPAPGLNTILSGSSASAIIVLRGADYICIDGSNDTLANILCPRQRTGRNLIIENSNTSGTSVVFAIQTAPDGSPACFNQLMNCVIRGSGPSATGAGVNISGTALLSGTGANQNNDNRIINNKIERVQVGVFSAGSSVTTKNLRNTFDLNELTSVAPDNIGRFGIMLLFEDSCMVRGNDIANIVSSASFDVVGISLGANSLNNSLTTAAETSNGYVSGNNIYNIVQTNTFSAGGIIVAATTSGRTRIENNMINRVFCNGTAGDFGCGIYNGGGSGLMEIYHNTVIVNGDPLTSASQPNMAVGINGATPSVDLRNNILVCSGSSGSNTNTGIGLAYSSTTGNYTNLISDNNDIYVSGTGSCTGRTGGLTAAGTARTSLADWQTETGRDQHSVAVLPAFVSVSDAHLLAGLNPGIEDGGTPLPVIMDIDCEYRNGCHPDMGADEFGLGRQIIVRGNAVLIPNGDLVPDASDSTWLGPQSVCNGTHSVNYMLYNTGTTDLSISGVQLTGADSLDFSLTAPASLIAAGDSSQMSLVFDPSDAGIRTAIIHIFTDDCNDPEYTFTVSGEGTETAVTVNLGSEPSCYGASDGWVYALATSGEGPFTFLWIPGGFTGDTLFALSADTIICVATDVNACSASDTMILGQPALITFNQTQTICYGEEYLIGVHAYDSSGIYIDTLSAMNGCDSIVTTDLTEEPPVDVSVSINMITITADNAGADYQWVDCNSSYAIIPGETGQSYTPSANGSYAVVVTQGICSDTSNCVIITTVGIETIGEGLITQVFPNPTGGICFLEIRSSGSLSIVNMLGEKVMQADLPAGRHRLDMSGLSAGLYLLEVSNMHGKESIRLVIE